VAVFDVAVRERLIPTCVSLYEIFGPNAKNGFKIREQEHFIRNIQCAVVDIGLVFIGVRIIVSRLIVDVVGICRKNIFGIQHGIGIGVGPILVSEKLHIERQDFIVSLFVRVASSEFESGLFG